MWLHGLHCGWVNIEWREKTLVDDPVVESNTRGTISFATSGPDSRTTQMFINFGDNSRLDGMGFSPFGKVVDGMDVVDRIYKVGEKPNQVSHFHFSHVCACVWWGGAPVRVLWLLSLSSAMKQTLARSKTILATAINIARFVRDLRVLCSSVLCLRLDVRAKSKAKGTATSSLNFQSSPSSKMCGLSRQRPVVASCEVPLCFCPPAL